MKRVGYIIEDDVSAQVRYRVKNVAELLDKSSRWELSFWRKNDDRLDNEIEKQDLLIIERQTAKDGQLPSLIKTAKKNGIKVLFDIDDLVFDYKYLHPIRKTAGKFFLYWIGYLWGIRRIAKRVDGFIVTNDFLGKRIKKTFNKPYKVIRNSLNKEQIEESKKIKKDKNKGFIIGYFSGSPTHSQDFGLIEPQLLRFLDAHEEAELMVVGYMTFDEKAKKYLNSGRIKVLAPVDYLKLLGLMAKVDVNIAPLVINDFTNCKSELKFFEAAVVETTTIASPSFAFKNAIMDGENGFLAEPDEWLKKLEYIYNHPEENKKIARAAYEYALKHYAGKEVLNEIEEAYDYFTK